MGLVDRAFLLSHPEFHQANFELERMIIPWALFLILYHLGLKP